MSNENARAALAKLEADLKHTTRSKEAEDQTRNGNLDDPKFQNKNHAPHPHKDDPEIDARWHKDANGNFSHPDFE